MSSFIVDFNDSISLLKLAGKWSCSQCSFLNMTSAQECIICSKPNSTAPTSRHRALNGRSSSPSKQYWSCNRCTFANIADLSSCELCEAPRKPNIPLTLPRKPIIINYDLDGKNAQRYVPFIPNINIPT